MICINRVKDANDIIINVFNCSTTEIESMAFTVIKECFKSEVAEEILSNVTFIDEESLENLEDDEENYEDEC
jgi:hypothetical protein